ncbi:MAG: DUF4091 domain-containing protein [Leptotrichiaceae bacterium]|nr:DUF4091 domain-containing protein [Leptotrichiaceae bacterium]
MRFYSSTHNFYRNSPLHNLRKFNDNTELLNLEVIKNEEFGFFVTVNFPCESCLNINRDTDLPWWGLNSRYRLEVNSELSVISPYLVDYVKDDEGTEIVDIILTEQSKVYPAGEVPVFLQGIIPEDFQGDKVTVNIKLFENNGYKKEKLIEEKNMTIDIIDYSLKNNDFFLDLWQHPCSWARTYNLEYFSEEHFSVIENYLKELAKLGQKVINLIVSDFPWAGQKCFDIDRNPSRLYEYNIIKVSRKNGNLNLDFSNLDRYVGICEKLGINEEINLFGLIGNWHGYDFGSPLTDYRDPIRISLYDEDEKVFDYIRDKSELAVYLKLLFQHFKNKNYLSKTKIIGDEPNSIKIFKEYSDFLSSCTEEKLQFKYAVHTPGFFEEYKGNLDSFSINTLLLGDYYRENNPAYEKLKENSLKMTWYSCCFPDTFNVFIKSPLIEARLTGLYTYLFRMKGMLRWAYGLYVEDVFSDISYKKEKWAAGDMLFVYPGKNMKPLHSLREKNMLYGIQDFNIFRQLESGYRDLYRELKKKLSVEELIKTENGDIKMGVYPDINIYRKIRNEFIKNSL